MAEIGFKSIEEIIGKQFFIPDYQRGYRWGKNQVLDLLNDLLEFNSEKQEKEIYCLQPLVVEKNKENNDVYDVIDGQQRLTTLNILLSCLGEQNKYSVTYQTREEEGNSSKDFLENILNEDKNNALKNADFYHMYHARMTIQDWLKDVQDLDKTAFLKMVKERVNFIWYELDPGTDQIDVFTKLNIGKIGLTESELIKALFLNTENFTSGQFEEEELITMVEMALGWDQIEYSLQDDRFWLFFHEAEYKKPTRIDYLFDLARENSEDGSNYEKYTYPTFSYYYNQFRNASDKRSYLTKCWKEIWDYFRILDEWFHDDIIYHYIGYLCSVDNMGKKKASFTTKFFVSEMIKEYKTDGVTKKKFIEILEKKIEAKLTVKDLNFEYETPKGKSKTEARPLLLLHNILTVIDRNDKVKKESKYNLPDFTRFPFHLFNKESWDVEHIRPNNTQDYDGERKKKSRAKYAYIQNKYYGDKLKDDSNNDLYEAYRDDYDKPGEETSFENLFEKVCELDSNSGSEELSDDEKNRIWNYVLLDASTNREYGNSCFAVKRNYIIQKQDGHKPYLEVVNDKGEVTEEPVEETAFVPVCTSNVFSKVYNGSTGAYPNNLNYWTKKDAENYLEDIKKRFQIGDDGKGRFGVYIENNTGEQ